MNNEKIVEDLLNLYAEGLLNEDSRNFVEKNLKQSKKLREKLKEIENDQVKFERKNYISLEFLSKKIDRDKKTYGIFLASLLLSIFLIIFSFLTRPIHYEDDGNLYKVDNLGEQIFLSFKKDIVKVNVYELAREDGTSRDIFIDAYTTKLDEILNKSSKQIIAFEKKHNTNIYYENHDKKASLIYGNVNEKGIVTLPRLAINYYFLIVSVGSGILIILLLLLKKYRKFIKYIIFLPVSYFLAYVSISGFNFHSYYMERDFFYIVFLWTSFYLLFISTIRLIWMKKDREIK